MTASQLQTLPVPPMLITTNSTGSVNPNRNNNISNTRNSAKRSLFGKPEAGEIKRIWQEENIRICTEFKEKYNYDILNERFTYDDNNSNNINNNNEGEITTTTPITTPEIEAPEAKVLLKNNHIIELIKIKNNGQDEQSNINLLKTTNLITATINDTEIIDINKNDDKSIIINNDKNLQASECDDDVDKNINNNNTDEKLLKLNDNNEVVVDNNEVGLSNNNNMSLNDNNNFNKCDVMCNQITTTSSSTITSTIIPSVGKTYKDKKIIQQQIQRFSPYSKNQTQQILISDMLKVRKASPVEITRPQKAKLHFDETDKKQQQQQQPEQEQHLTSNEA